MTKASGTIKAKKRKFQSFFVARKLFKIRRKTFRKRLPVIKYIWA